LTGYFWGKLGDKYGYKSIIPPMIILSSLVITLFPFAGHNKIILLGLYTFYCVFICELGSMTNVFLADVGPEKSHGLVFGLAHTFTQMAMATGPLIGGWIAVSFGITYVFYGVAICFGLALVVFISGQGTKYE
jgi:DHA1 family multidrug resistance protein-like MFS transporter